MKNLSRLMLLIFGIIYWLCANAADMLLIFDLSFGIRFLICFFAFIGVILLNVFPLAGKYPSKKIAVLRSGCDRLRLFMISTVLTVAFQTVLAIKIFPSVFPWDGVSSGVILGRWSLCALAAVIAESAVFWNGMIRVYIYSVQLGLKHRVLAALFGWIPILNIIYLIKIVRITDLETETETEKLELDDIRAESAVCATRYPILMVHGVFFRDSRYINYWGRIPAALARNGAKIYYGGQQSADSVENCGKELAEKIKSIVCETGCEKVNIIAHSKGGLDSRAAISHYGAAPYVASLTTINTPHNGCIFAEYLLNKVPAKAKNAIAKTYNSTLLKLGDHSPDFLAAVSDLSESACLERNKALSDAEGVLYESVMSYCKKAKSGKFPINVSYPFVKHFDGKNDGLVSVRSAKWGSRFTLIEPLGKRGISHGDMIDLNRENIPGFDVREFYVQTAARLRELGY